MSDLSHLQWLSAASPENCYCWSWTLEFWDEAAEARGSPEEARKAGGVGVLQPAGTVAFLDGDDLFPKKSTFTSYHSDIKFIHVGQYMQSFVFCQSAKSCFLWSPILCSMSNWSASTPFKELENWLVLKSTQGEFRISLSFASLDICCWLQEAWGEQQLLFHFCFDNSETPSLATTVLIMKLRNLNFLSTAHSHRL